MRSLFKQLNKIALAMVLVIMLQMLIVPQMSFDAQAGEDFTEIPPQQYSLQFQHGEAKAGEDFTEIPLKKYSSQFQPGETSKKISVETIDDDLPEDDEIFYVTLSEIQGMDVTVPRTRVKILDNDSDQNPEFHPTVNVRGSSAVENTRSGKVEFILYLNAPVDEEVTVNYTTLDGTAYAGSDYIRKSGQCIVGKGALECSVEVELINDSNEEGDEFFYLEVLDSNSSSVVVFDDTKALAEIKDDDD